MRNECNIVRDLLPLYAENMVSPDTAAFVEEHLKDCEACQKEYGRTKEPRPVQAMPNTAPLLKLQHKMKIKRIQTIVLTAIFMIALLVSAFAVLDAPIYLPYSEGAVVCESLGDKGMLLTFAEEATDYDYTIYKDPDGEDIYYCDIQAWTSLWDKWFSQGKEPLSAVVTARNDLPLLAVYVPNDGSENICIAKYDPLAENPVVTDVDYKNTIALPRLSLGYYLIFAAGALVVLIFVWLLTQRNPQLRVWVERAGLYPVAYIISHGIVSGIGWTSYSLPRDLSLIVFISILLYGCLLLAHNIWQLRKEIKEINQ